MQDDAARMATIAQLRSICTDGLSARMPDFTENRGFFEREVEWCIGKTDADRVTIITCNLANSRHSATHELAEHCYSWFDGHSTFQKNEEFKRFADAAYSLENFVTFIRTLTYGQISRWLEEAITDGCNQELILSLLQ